SAAFAISPTKLAPAQTSPKTSRACRVPAYPLPLESNSEKGPFVAQGYHLHASVPPVSNPSRSAKKSSFPRNAVCPSVRPGDLMHYVRLENNAKATVLMS